MSIRKITIVSLSLIGGGSEKVAVNLANYFVNYGLEVDLLLFEASGPYLKQVDCKVNIIDLELKPIRNLRVFGYISPVRSYLKKTRPDVVLSVVRGANIIVGLAAIGLNLPQVVFHEASNVEGVFAHTFIKRMIYVLSMRIAYRQSTKIIANSVDTINGFIDNNLFPESKGVVIGNPVLPANYYELSLEKTDYEFHLPDKTKIVLGIGRLHPHKNFSHLIHAFTHVTKANPSIKLIILGEGPEEVHLKTLIKDLKLENSVKLIGFKANVFSYLRKADVFVLSSKWEGFGNVIVESLAVGTPVVSVDCPGGPRMILENGKYGKLVPPNDELALAQGIIESLSESHDKKKLIERAQCYTVEHIANEYLKLLQG